MEQLNLKMRLVALLCRFLPVSIGAPFALYHQIRFLWPSASSKLEVLALVKNCMAIFRHESGNFTSAFYKRSNNVGSMREATKRQQWGVIGETGAEGLFDGYVVYKSYFWATLDFLRWWSVSHGFKDWSEMQSMGVLNTSDGGWYSIQLGEMVSYMKQVGYFTANEQVYFNGSYNFRQEYHEQDERNILLANRIFTIALVSVSLAVFLATWMLLRNNQTNRKKLLRS